jgi:hypothetical protein
MLALQENILYKIEPLSVPGKVFALVSKASTIVPGRSLFFDLSCNSSLSKLSELAVKGSQIMDWMNQIGSLVEKFTGGQGTQPATDDDALHQILHAVPKSALSGGLAEAFRSDQTPAFGQMAAQMFTNANPQQRAGLLNTLIAVAGPTVLSKLAPRGGALGLLAGLLGSGQTEVTPELAEQVTPDDVQELATQTEQHDPSVIDRISDFYSEHPTLVKTIGAAAIGIIMAKIAQRQ